MSEIMSSERGVRDLPAQIHGFALMHVAMRRDTKRLADAAPRVTPANVRAVTSWWKLLHDVIDWHHRSEDDVLWPAVRALVPGFATVEREMLHDHTALEEAMAQVTAALRRSTGLSALAPAAHRLHQVLVDHLRHEEAAVFPVLTRDLQTRQYLGIEQRVVGSAPPRVLSYLQPWMFDGADPAVIPGVAATIPPPVRLLGNTLLRRRYERTVAPVLALT